LAIILVGWLMVEWLIATMMAGFHPSPCQMVPRGSHRKYSMHKDHQHANKMQ
jgi:hypothetical protein